MGNLLRRIVGALAVTGALLFGAACGAHLAPSYEIERQELEVGYVAAATPHLHLRATYRLRNNGNSELAEIGARLPDLPAFGRENLRATSGGRELSIQPSSEPDGHEMRISFGSSWPQRQHRVVVLEYDLAPAPPGNAAVAVNPGSFHVRDEAAFPELRPPLGPLAKGGARPAKFRFVVRAPRDFRVFASGREEHLRRHGDETEHELRMAKSDFQLFAAGGAYQEQRIDAAGGSVIFWTFQPLDAERVRAAATRLAATRQALQSAFGPIGKNLPPEHLIETPAMLAQSEGRGDGPSGVALPAGALLNRRAFALDVSSEAFLDLVEHDMAHHWFGQFIEPIAEVKASLGEGLAEYASLVAAEARGGEAERRHRVALLLREYDESRARVAEKPLRKLRISDPFEQRAFGYSKGALLFVALEDQYGRENVRRALAHVAGALRGSGFGYAVVFSALEQETKQDLGEFFRTWLNQPGLPAQFRARYQEKAEATK